MLFLPREALPWKGEADWTIRLPTEWEWQQAATGGLQDREYPWEEGWDSARCNTAESGLSRTTAVGMYPQGASPVGALDMAGNVWEWCLYEYEIPRNVGLGGDAARGARGGSFGYIAYLARYAYRHRNFPWFYNGSLGFRVVCVVAP